MKEFYTEKWKRGKDLLVQELSKSHFHVSSNSNNGLEQIDVSLNNDSPIKVRLEFDHSRNNNAHNYMYGIYFGLWCEQKNLWPTDQKIGRIWMKYKQALYPMDSIRQENIFLRGDISGSCWVFWIHAEERYELPDLACQILTLAQSVFCICPWYSIGENEY